MTASILKSPIPADMTEWRVIEWRVIGCCECMDRFRQVRRNSAKRPKVSTFFAAGEEVSFSRAHDQPFPREVDGKYA